MLNVLLFFIVPLILLMLGIFDSDPFVKNFCYVAGGLAFIIAILCAIVFMVIF